jgi:hypothetical protein
VVEKNSAVIEEIKALVEKHRSGMKAAASQVDL